MRYGNSPPFRPDDIEFDPVTETYQVSFDPECIPDPTVAVVNLISEITDSSPMELPPLGSVVDVDSLDSLLYTRQDPEMEAAARFTYAGFSVQLESSGKISVQATERSSDDVPGPENR